LKHSDFSKVVTSSGEIDKEAIVPVRCKKLNRNLPVRIWDGCVAADPRTRWRLTPAGNKVPSGGDKTGASTPVERAFLEVVYPHLPSKLIIEATGRDWDTVKMMATKRGWKRTDDAMAQACRAGAEGPKAARRRMGLAFTTEQSVYINARHLAGHRNEGFRGLPPEWVWPRYGWGTPALSRRNRAVKASIMAEVAKRGPARTWDAIRRHPEWCSTRYQKQHKQRAIKRLVRNAAKVGGAI
jgi:hypothetical protein